MSVWEQWRHRGASEIIDRQRRSFQANGTIGYDELAWLTVTKVNGKEIKSLADLAEPVNQRFIKIETEEDPKQTELDAAQVGRWSTRSPGKLWQLFAASPRQSGG
jgi:PDZ domain